VTGCDASVCDSCVFCVDFSSPFAHTADLSAFNVALLPGGSFHTLKRIFHFGDFVKPHEFTAENREAFRRAVDKRRNPQADAPLCQRAPELLAHRRRPG
jgi:hypothetical protein